MDMPDDWYDRYLMLEAGMYPPAEAASDEAEQVRWRAASMPLPARTVERLADDPGVSVRAAVAARGDLTADLIDDFAYDASPVVRRVLAARGDLTDRARRRLVRDDDPDVLDTLGEAGRAAVIRAMPAPLTRPRRGVMDWLAAR